MSTRACILKGGRQSHAGRVGRTALRQRFWSQQASTRHYHPRLAPRLSPFAIEIAALPGSPLLDAMKLFRLNRIRLSEPKKEDEPPPEQVVIASSAVVAEPSFLQRWLHLFQSWLETAYKAWMIAARSTEVALRLSPLVILTPAAAISQSPRVLEWTWQYTLTAVQGLGPVAIKFCQWMATRRDLFPANLCDRLGVLHDRGYPHSWEYSHQMLTEAFGDYQSKGLVVEEVVGCGSAAQVYKGRWVSKAENTNNGEGREVAIKVLHPNFSQNVERDLSLMTSMADLLHSLPVENIRMLNLPRATVNFGELLRSQADLTNEADNLLQFRSNFFQNNPGKEKNAAISFPQPLKGWSSPKVLVEDYIHDAQPIANYLQDSTPDGVEMRRQLAGPLLRAFLKMVFMDNFVHGDLHPGNVMVRSVVSMEPSRSWFSFGTPKRDDRKVVKWSIVFLDAGIANSLKPDDQRNLRDLFRAVLFNDGNRAGRLMVERAKFERCSEVPGGVEAFARGVEDIVSEFHTRRKEGLTLGAVRIGSLLSRVLGLCQEHGVEIDPEMASVVISTFVLEGLGRSLSPELNLIDFAKPFLLGKFAG